jgi:hypothetical protein
MQHSMRNEKDMKRVFQNFLTNLANLDSLSISLPQPFFEQSLVEQEIPMLQDPVNPLRNAFSGMDESVMSQIKQQAQQSLEILNRESAKLSELFNVGGEQKTKGTGVSGQQGTTPITTQRGA